MKLTRFRTASEFLDRTGMYLERKEVENCLILGVCSGLIGNPDKYGSDPFLAAVESDRGIAVCAIMTPPFNLLVQSDDDNCDRYLHTITKTLIEEGWSVPGVLGRSAVSRAFAGVWSEKIGTRSETGMLQRVYRLDRVKFAGNAPGRLRRARMQDLETIVRWIAVFFQEALDRSSAGRDPVGEARSRIDERKMWIWDDDGPVSMAGAVRPAGSGISVSLVYTPPELRRRGYATSCVAQLSKYLLDSGYAYCSLFTDLSNSVSNSIYQKIGYRPVCDFDEYLFLPCKNELASWPQTE